MPTQPPSPRHAATVHIVPDVLQYIEAHLLDEGLALEGIAAQFHLSISAMGALFAAVCDLSPMEYVRNRRLSRAGQELLNTGKRVIDVALEHGYETPEAFAKAFARFYGLPPGMVRRIYPSLRTFAPLTVHIAVCGGWDSPCPEIRTDVQQCGQESATRSGYTVDNLKQGGLSMAGKGKVLHLALEGMERTQDWRVLLDLADALGAAHIAFKVDGGTMVFAHGLEFPLEKICLTFGADQVRAACDFFGFRGKVLSPFPGFRYFDASHLGMKVRCMFYAGNEGEASLFRNTDTVCIDGHALRVQSLEFYIQNTAPGEKHYGRVERHLASQP